MWYPVVRRSVRGLLPRYCALLLAASIAACGGDDPVSPPPPPPPIGPPPPPPPPPAPGNISGLVRRTGSTTPIAGAVITIGNLQTTTGVDGSFELLNVPGGSRQVRCAAPGYGPHEAFVTITSGATTIHNISMSTQEIFEFRNGLFSLYVPFSVTTVRAVVFAVGGPDTRPWANPGRSFDLEPDAPPTLEGQLGAMGQAYRLLAEQEGLAILGVATGQGGSMMERLEEAAVVTGRPELATAPLLLHSQSGGTFTTVNLATNHPSRVVGVVLKVPVALSMAAFHSAAEVVPAYVITAALDEVVDNNATRTIFNDMRAAGRLWAFAEEPGLPHRSISSAFQQAALNWLMTILELRQPTTPGGPLRVIDEESGWLGDPVTRAIAPWAEYVGDRRAASWLPSQAAAERWRNLVQ